MAPNIPSAKITLSCPLFAADFDPRNHAFLLVAGGGGESRSGVGNKIVRPHAFSFPFQCEISITVGIGSSERV